MNSRGAGSRSPATAIANTRTAHPARQRTSGKDAASSVSRSATKWFFGNAFAATSEGEFEMLSRQLSAKHREEIEKRGLDVGLAQQYGFKTVGDHIGFEYRVNGQVHNTKIRRGKGDMPWAETGKPLVLWNFDCLKGDASGDRQLIITEGEYDALACIQAGFLDAVSVPNGAPVSENEEGKARYAYLYRDGELLPEIHKFSSFILAVDGDEKGRFLRDALAARLGEYRCFWVEWPKSCKDANDVLREKGASALTEYLSNAKRMWIDEVATLDDIPDPEKETSFHIGFPELQPHLRFPRSGFITVLGPYESGKSTFLRQLMYNMSMNHGWRSAITCFEEKAKWRTVNALRKTCLGKPLHLASDREFEAATDWVRRNIVFIQKKKRTLMTGQRLLERIEYAVKVYGLNMVIIDPLNEVDHHIPSGTSKTDYIGNFIMEFKDLADSYGIVLICCVHPPSESMRRHSSGKSKTYTLADASDSANFAHKSDIGLCFWRPDAEHVALMNIDKIKHTELCGTPTGVEFRFLPDAERYTVSRTGWDVLYGEEPAA
jgi:twinkle protein